MGVLRQGARKARREALRKAKWHKKEVYRTLEELEFISTAAHIEGVIFTEDNIEDEVAKFSDIKLGAMEKMILLNKQIELANKDEQDKSEEH